MRWVRVGLVAGLIVRQFAGAQEPEINARDVFYSAADMMGAKARPSTPAKKSTPWPVADSAWLTADTVSVAVQVNGKRRGEIVLPPGCPREQAEALALAEPNVLRAMEGKPPRKVIVVPDKIVNVVV